MYEKFIKGRGSLPAMAKNIITVIAILLFLVPFAFAVAPVWTAIPDQQVVAGNTLTFPVSASDADNDIIMLDIASAPILGVTFLTSNGTNGTNTGTFTWATTANQVGVYDIIFRASAAGEQTLETARITVTIPINNSLSQLEQEYNSLVDEFNDLEDDYSITKRRYERAVDDDDERDIDDYTEKLEDIDNDLADLEDDAEDLLDDVEDSNLDNRRELADDIEDVQDDIERVRDRIDTLLNVQDNDAAGTVVSTYTPAPRAEPQPERTRVIVGSLDFAGGNVPNTVEEPIDNWEETRKIVWVGAGIVVLIAVIIFLTALMVV